MMTASFDTLAYAKKLIAAGFTQQQAEVQAEVLKEIIDEKLATKQDLKDAVKDLRHEIREMEYRLAIKVGGMYAASIAIIVALMKFVH
jgi:hypothetical protein